MANEKKLIPFFGNQLEQIVNGFILRLFIIVYYGGLISLLILTIILYQDETERGVNSRFGPEYDDTVKGGGIFFIYLFGYWISIYILSNVFTWLFTGKSPRK